MIREILEFSSGYHLKNMKSMQGRQGTAWSATLYKGDRKLGSIIDEANGGPISIDIAQADLAELTETAEQRVPGPVGGVEIFVAALGDYADTVRTLKAKNSKRPVRIYTDVRDDHGVPVEYSQFKASNTPETLAAIRAQIPDVVLLDDDLHLWELRSKPAQLAAALAAMPNQTEHADTTSSRSRPRG